MNRNMRANLTPRRLCAVIASLLPVAGFVNRPACSAQPTTTTASAPAREGRSELQAALAAAEKALADRGPALEKRLETLAGELKDLEARRGSITAAELTERKERLTSERAALQKEIGHLESAKTAWQAALDACESADGFRKQLTQFQDSQQREEAKFVPADVAAFESQLSGNQSNRTALDEGQAVLAKRLDALAEEIKKADDQTRPLLDAEQSAILAEAGAGRQKRVALDAERALLEAKLAAARHVLGARAAKQTTTTCTAPAPKQAEVLNKQRLAEQLETEARRRLEDAQTRLKEIQRQLEQAAQTGRATTQLENDREYWQRLEAYENRRLVQAELQKRVAQEKQESVQLEDRIEAARKNLEQLRGARKKTSRDDRKQQAVRFREQAAAARLRAGDLDKTAEAERKKILPVRQMLDSLDVIEWALRQREQEAADAAGRRELSAHFDRMKPRFDIERQQIDLMMMTRENIVYAIRRRGDLERELAGVYTQSADVLDPPVPTFWERHRNIVNAIKIVLAVVAISYGVKLLVWLIQRGVKYLNSVLSSVRSRFSVKRAGTLVSFAGSIIKLFVWIFGAIAVLNEFGVDYAKSTGAIGLIGLIMAGMFQQIVVDFVKGLDIIGGGHYNVGDFVEVDGKYGHVVDFTVKHTRIRTLSGQEFNIPNSKCVPSRLFPDGYVNNYVDIPLKSIADEQRAQEVIDPLCEDLNHRVEAMRSTPRLVVCFDEAKGRVVMRYRVSVLPGCDWVLNDYFIPTVKQALADAGIELAGEPTFFFINRLRTFRKLFSRQLSEAEIARQLDEEEIRRRLQGAQQGPTTDERGTRQVTSPTDENAPG